MRTLRTTSWICDVCGQPIRSAEHGWVEWVELPVPDGEPLRIRGIRLVHCHSQSPLGPGRCQYDGRTESVRDGGAIADDALTEFLGPDGLMQLLELLVEHGDVDAGLLELIKRLHIPGYEHARRHFRWALTEGLIELSVAFGYWRQKDFRRILRAQQSAE
jgi:hypothetical protein